MNYIISSIILLVVVLIIIYLFSIDNNIDRFKNKIKDTCTTIKTEKTNYISETDSMILLQFLKSHYNLYDNILIPKKIFYILNKDEYTLKEINIIGYKINDNFSFGEVKHTITIKFIPIKNELFIGRYTLFGVNGNYYIETDINDEKSKSNKKLQPIIKNTPIETKPSKNESIKNKIDDNPLITATDILDMIPDIIHLSSDEKDTERITTVTPAKKITFSSSTK
jgi:hypothetical protein